MSSDMNPELGKKFFVGYSAERRLFNMRVTLHTLQLHHVSVELANCVSIASLVAASMAREIEELDL